MLQASNALWISTRGQRGIRSEVIDLALSRFFDTVTLLARRGETMLMWDSMAAIHTGLNADELDEFDSALKRLGYFKSAMYRCWRWD